MRQIISKYGGECARCGKEFSVGDSIVYEKTTGVFCPGCEPIDTEDIRKFRQVKADRKAGRYEGWAAKREAKAKEQLNSMPTIRHDWAFITQPGRIPLREKMNQADDRARESLNVAERMRGKAEGIRNVHVAGDAERKRQAHRDELDKLISKGSKVHDFTFGNGEVIGIYKKSYRIKFDRGFTYSRDKSFIQLI